METSGNWHIFRGQSVSCKNSQICNRLKKYPSKFGSYRINLVLHKDFDEDRRRIHEHWSVKPVAPLG